jgi:hypothetical protein
VIALSRARVLDLRECASILAYRVCPTDPREVVP